MDPISIARQGVVDIANLSGAKLSSGQIEEAAALIVMAVSLATGASLKHAAAAGAAAADQINNADDAQRAEDDAR